MVVRAARHSTVVAIALALLLFGITPGRSTPGVSNGLIVFVSDRDPGYGIFVMNPDGSGQTDISNNPAYDWGPSWSPDGTRVAFASDRDGPWSQIYVMNADGSGVTKLTAGFFGEEAWGPAW